MHSSKKSSIQDYFHNDNDTLDSSTFQYTVMNGNNTCDVLKVMGSDTNDIPLDDKKKFLRSNNLYDVCSSYDVKERKFTANVRVGLKNSF